MPLGYPSDTTTNVAILPVSKRDDLLRQRNVSGNGTPSHTPEVDTQTYVNIATGVVHEWWGGAWH